MAKGFTKAQRKRFEKAREKLAPRIQNQLDAIEKSTILSAVDFAVRINAKG